MGRLLERERAFTADVSHELRTPLTSIQTSCELMLEDRGLSPKARERLEKIDAAAARLADLVNAFLLMAREEAEHVQWVTRAMEYVRADGVDWDSLLAAGGGPGLALGGERRLRKGPPPSK